MKSNLSSEILKLRKVVIKGYDIPVAFITNIEIYESLTQAGITGYIDIKDYQALFELGNVFAGDEITISYTIDDDESNEMEVKFVIFTNEGSKQLALNTYDVARFGFCSAWLIEGLSRCISKPYKNMYISSIIEDLLRECGAEIAYIEPTKQKLETFVTPYWTAYHSIKYLMELALNNNSVGGYVCWTDLRSGRVYVTTLDYLLQGKLGTSDKPFSVYPANYRYVGRIKNMNVEASYDTIRMINNGIPETKYYSFNFDKNKIEKTKNNIEKTNQTRISSKFPMDKKYKDKKYILHKYTPLFPSTARSISSDDSKLTDLLEGKEKSNYSYMTTDTFKINIETLGEMDRRVGWLVTLDYPSVAAPSNKDVDFISNRQLAGTYLIREIKHVFSLYQDYTQYVTLVSDGYKEFQADLITW